MRAGSSLRRRHVVALDFGMKWNILRHLVDIGCKVTVMPGSASAEAILDAQPDGIFLSNGPGDPEPLAQATATLRTLIRSAADSARHPDLRDLPGTSASRPGLRCADLQAQVRPSRRQSSGPQPGDRQGRDHDAEPRLRRRPHHAAPRRRAQPRQPERPDARRTATHALAGLRRPVSPRGLGRPARQPLPLRRVLADDGLKSCRPAQHAPDHPPRDRGRRTRHRSNLRPVLPRDARLVRDGALRRSTRCGAGSPRP